MVAHQAVTANKCCLEYLLLLFVRFVMTAW